jgi:hypothetical protein
MNPLRYAYLQAFRVVGKRIGGESIWNQDWDVLTVLDGCRYDTFKEEFDPEVDRIRSVGSTSHTWLSKTFSDRDTSSIAYISGNPYASSLDSDEFAYFHLEPVKKTEYGVETVPPEQLTERAIHVWRNREHLDVESMVVHYMQPHVPFRSRPEWFEEWKGTNGWGSGIWSSLRTGELNHEAFFEAYRDNLRWVLEDGIDTLRENCEAQIAITADHGNAAGEWFLYGHPTGGLAPSIRDVPWVILEGNDRKTLSPTITESSTDIDREAQLQALGYV